MKLNPDPPQISHRSYFLALLLIGAIFFKPFVTFQPFLSQGDHGLNLYAAQAVLKGDVPIQSFSWFYGPAMPYYYALALQMFGHGIQSILLAKIFLILLSGFLIYFNLALIIPRMIAALGALWFWVFFKDFPFTFNHAGGIPVILIISYFTFRFLKDPNIKFLYASLAFIFLLFLIKLNFGFAALFALLLIVFINSSLKKEHPAIFYILSLTALPVAVILAYWLFFHDLPFHYIKQCLPYFAYLQPAAVGHEEQRAVILNILVNGYLVIKNIFSSWSNIAFALLINLAGIKCIIDWRKKEFEGSQRFVLLFLLTVLVFYVFYLHEFLILSVFYQAYWAEPFKILLMFGVIGLALRNVAQPVQIIVSLVILTLAFFQVPHEYTALSTQYKNPRVALKVSGTNIDIGNDEVWAQTVTQTTDYLKKNLKDDQMFWAIPYDPLYYFLTNKTSPTKELLLLNISVSQEQELAIIKDLEEKKVDWIVWSNRANEPGITSVSEKYCPTLEKYIYDHFAVETQFGDWNAEPHWWTNHAVRVWKRK